MPLDMITREQLYRFAPHADPKYVAAILGGETALRDAGVLDEPLTLAHFLAQCGAETDGFRIVRESLTYTSVSRVREVWPARARKCSNEFIKLNLIRNPIALGDWAYGGREGNRKGTKDGFNFRGGGPLQTTHANAVKAYCKALNIPARDDILDDIPTTLLFACSEWKSSNCGKYAKQNNILAVSKIINTGSATSGVMPNGLADRKAWFKKAWGVWGDQRETIPHVTDLTVTDLRSAGSETIKSSDLLKIGSTLGGVASLGAGVAGNSGIVETLPSIPQVEPIQQIRNMTESADAMTAFATSFKGLVALAVSNIWVLGLVCGVGGYFLAKHIINRRLTDARLGYNTARVV